MGAILTAADAERLAGRVLTASLLSLARPEALAGPAGAHQGSDCSPPRVRMAHHPPDSDGAHGPASYATAARRA